MAETESQNGKGKWERGRIKGGKETEKDCTGKLDEDCRERERKRLGKDRK